MQRSSKSQIEIKDTFPVLGIHTGLSPFPNTIVPDNLRLPFAQDGLTSIASPQELRAPQSAASWARAARSGQERTQPYSRPRSRVSGPTLPVHSPLLRQSRLSQSPLPTDMLKFGRSFAAPSGRAVNKSACVPSSCESVGRKRLGILHR
jgi:hypothetical protein